MSDSSATISASVFVVVAFVHLAKPVKCWPVKVAAYSVPMSVSWLGMPVSALLAIWSFLQLGH
jgi:hypothetical protein